MMGSNNRTESLPSASRLVTALRDVGYDFPGAVADLVDNSIAAGATSVEVLAEFDGEHTTVRISDNGTGMNADTISESLRFGSRREYGDDDLGKFGLGLKTASLSQCRRVSVASRMSAKVMRVEARAMDLDEMQRADRWEIEVLRGMERPEQLIEPLLGGPGTVVLWENLDRLLPYKRRGGERARRGLLDRLEGLDRHLGMVFHRFLSGEIPDRPALAISINGTPVESWDPFARDEPETEKLQVAEFDVIHDGTAGVVTFQPYVLPNKHQFSTPLAHERAGRGRWNQSQGLWVYRANRLIQDGGWRYLRAADEHTKYARGALDFFPDLDEAFGINIAKMRVNLPATLRDDLRIPTETQVRRAKQRYADGREKVPSSCDASRSRDATGSPAGSEAEPNHDDAKTTEATAASAPLSRAPYRRRVLEEAASFVGEAESLKRIMKQVKRIDGETAHDLGW